MQDNNLTDRLFNFAIRVLKYLTTLPNTPEFKIIRYQLAKSATSTGANYEEAQAGSSRADFHNKTRISLKEMRESNYWLRIIDGTIEDKLKKEELKLLIDESAQLKNILGTIVYKTRFEKEKVKRQKILKQKEKELNAE